MRLDIEVAAAELFAEFLKKYASTQPGQVTDALACPVVTFFDPMSVDDADRVVVMCPDAETDAAEPGHFTATVDVGIKTLWKQASIKADFLKHFARVKDVRDKLNAVGIIGLLTPLMPAGMALDFVNPKKRFKTHIAESSAAKWIYSGAEFEIAGYFTAES